MSYLSDFEHTKLDAKVFPGYVIEKYYISNAKSGQRRIPKTKIWKVGRLLGQGSFGEVRVESYDEENEERAVKRIHTSSNELKKSYKRELKAMLEFSKPKYKESAVFVDFFGWFEDSESVYLAMEYIPLGDLEENVQALGGSLKETEVRDITIQVLDGLKIMHLESFAHRDLKPKNVLVCQGAPSWWIKLADFGLSKRQTDETGYRTQTGTFAYMAPEILNYVADVDPENLKYTNAVDMWALGCIVYRLACGVVPFLPGLSLVRFCENESAFPLGPIPFSDYAKKFVKDLVVSSPAQRLTAQEALDHPWTKVGLKNADSDSSSVASFGGYNTATHAGLQSMTLKVLNTENRSTAANRASEVSSSCPSTLEDENKEEVSGAQILSDSALTKKIAIVQQRPTNVSTNPERTGKGEGINSFKPENKGTSPNLGQERPNSPSEAKKSNINHVPSHSYEYSRDPPPRNTQQKFSPMLNSSGYYSTVTKSSGRREDAVIGDFNPAALRFNDFDLSDSESSLSRRSPQVVPRSPRYPMPTSDEYVHLSLRYEREHMIPRAELSNNMDRRSRQGDMFREVNHAPPSNSSSVVYSTANHDSDSGDYPSPVAPHDLSPHDSRSQSRMSNGKRRQDVRYAIENDCDILVALPEERIEELHTGTSSRVSVPNRSQNRVDRTLPSAGPLTRVTRHNGPSNHRALPRKNLQGFELPEDFSGSRSLRLTSRERFHPSYDGVPLSSSSSSSSCSSSSSSSSSSSDEISSNAGGRSSRVAARTKRYSTKLKAPRASNSHSPTKKKP